MSITLKSVTVTLICCPQFKNHFINECALIYNIYFYIYYISLHITVKKIIQLQQAIECCCLCLTMSNAKYSDIFSLTSPSSGLTLWNHLRSSALQRDTQVGGVIWTVFGIFTFTFRTWGHIYMFTYTFFALIRHLSKATYFQAMMFLHKRETVSNHRDMTKM